MTSCFLRKDKFIHDGGEDGLDQQELIGKHLRDIFGNFKRVCLLGKEKHAENCRLFSKQTCQKHAHKFTVVNTH